ncbi:transposase, partial [Breznakiellaceae bacterium SP9]
MKLTEKLYNRIKSLLPKQRGNVKFENKTFLEAIIYVLENGCKWRALPKEYGP